MSVRWAVIGWRSGRQAGRMVLLVLLLVSTQSCKALKHIFEEPPPLPDKHPTHDLIIERGVARFNGTPIAPGVPLSRWVELLGEPDRVDGQYHLWDRVGLGAASIDQHRRLHAARDSKASRDPCGR